MRTSEMEVVATIFLIMTVCWLLDKYEGIIESHKKNIDLRNNKLQLEIELLEDDKRRRGIR